MADPADIASSFIEDEVLRALGKMRQGMLPQQGAKNCKDCSEDMPEARQKLGFQLCIECATEREKRKSQFAD